MNAQKRELGIGNGINIAIDPVRFIRFHEKVVSSEWYDFGQLLSPGFRGHSVRMEPGARYDIFGANFLATFWLDGNWKVAAYVVEALHLEIAANVVALGLDLLCVIAGHNLVIDNPWINKGLTTERQGRKRL